MTWLVWRQHRQQLLFGVAGLIVLGAFFLATGLPIHDRFEEAGLPDCLPQTIDSTVVANLYEPIATGPSGTGNTGGTGDDSTEAITRCAQTADDFYDDYQSVVDVGFLLLILPMLVGIFWGAPLVAREIEHGTHRLVWTQGTSRLRWAATKFGLVSIGVLAMTAVFAAMLNWWITPVMQTSGQRFDYIFFDIHGIVVFGYATFALALGIFAGAVTGRLLPAMATTVVGFLAVRLVVMLVARDHYLPTETRRISVAGLALGDSYPAMEPPARRLDTKPPLRVSHGVPGRCGRLRRDADHAPRTPLLGLPNHRNVRSSSRSPSACSSPPSTGSGVGSAEHRYATTKDRTAETRA